MFYLILAVLGSAGVSFTMRLSVRYIKNNITMVSISYLCCSLLALIHGGGTGLAEPGIGTALGLGLAAGVLLLGGFLALEHNTRVNGVVLTGVFSRLGVLVPTLASIVLFHERPQVLQILGFLLALGAIVLMSGDFRGSQAGSAAGLLLLLLTCGLADTMSKVYEQFGSPALESLYLLISFLTAFLLSGCLAVYKKQSITPGDIGFGLLLGIPNFYSIRFLIRALSRVPAVVAYPTFSVGAIGLITAVGILVFREKLTRTQIFAMVLILAALVFLNL